MSRLLLIFLLFCPLVAQAQAPPTPPAIVLPEEGKAVGVVKVSTPSGWACLSQDFDAVEIVLLEGDDKTGYKSCVIHGLPGKYAVLQINGFKVTTHKVILGNPSPTPPPPPPGPGPGPPPPPPGPGPEPPPNPTPAGTRTVLILYESEQKTPELSRLITDLTNASSPRYKYLQDKGHMVAPLDDDLEDASGRPFLDGWRPLVPQLPAIVIQDAKTKAILVKQALPATFTGTDVINLLQKHGG